MERVKIPTSRTGGTLCGGREVLPTLNFDGAFFWAPVNSTHIESLPNYIVGSPQATDVASLRDDML